MIKKEVSNSRFIHRLLQKFISYILTYFQRK